MASTSVNDKPTSTVPILGRMLVGRVALIDQLLQGIAAQRLLTLTGPGGVGKTSVAQQVAARLAAADAFADGVRWVDLAGLADGALVPQGVATACGLTEQRGRSWMDLLVAALRTSRLLLVLDTCEHLRGACAELCTELIAACPQVHILVTSREPFGIEVEQRCLIPPLDAAASAALFVLRATERQPSFMRNEGTAAAIAAICARVDGVPLAIELAAARVALLSVAQIAERLEQSLALLVDRQADRLLRQHSLRAVLDWSYALLNAEEQALFKQLAVFAGSFDLDAVEVRCDVPAALDALAELVDKSLLVVLPGELSTRYRMHTVVREYAAEQLCESGEHTLVHSRHLAWAIDLAERAELLSRRVRQDAGLALLALEHENLRAALQTAANTNAYDLLRLAGALGPLWNSISMSEGRAWLARARALAPQLAATISSVRAWNCESFLAYRQGDYDIMQAAATAALREALAIEHAEGIADAAYRLGIYAEMKGEAPQARDYYQQSLALYQELGDWRGANQTLNGLAHVAGLEGRPAEARQYYRQGLALARAADDHLTIALLLISLGNLTLDGGELDTAEALYTESLAHLHADGNSSYLPYVLSGLGEVAHFRKDLVGAAAHYQEGLRAARALGLRDMEAQFLAHLGRVATARGDYPQAARSLSDALRLYLPLERTARTAGMIHWCAELLVALGRPSQATTLFVAGLRAVGADDFAYLGSAAEALEQRRAAARNALDPVEYALAVADGIALTLPRAAELALSAVWLPPRPLHTAAPELHIFAFGRLRVVREGRELTADDWVYSKTRDLLLLLQVDSASKAEIGAALWPDASPAQLRQNFRVAIYHLRRALGGTRSISFNRGRYGFGPEPGAWVDVAAFERALSRAADEPAQRRAHLRVAAALYTGDLDLGELHNDALLIRRERLRQQALDALLELGALYEAAAEHGAAADAFRRAIALDGYGEAAHRGLMRSLTRAGEGSVALAHYRRLGDLLQRELGAAPAPETAALAARIQAGVAL